MTGQLTTILALAERVEGLADQVQDIAAENARAAVAQDRRARLAEVTQGLLQLEREVRELNQLGIEWPSIPDLNRFRETKASRDGKWLTSQTGLTFLDALTSITRSLGQVVEGAWGECTEAHVSAFPDKATLRLLRERGGDDETLEAIDTLEHLSEDFTELRRQRRPESGNAEALTNLRRQVDAAWNRVRAGGELTPGRLELLRSVNSVAGKSLSEIGEDDLLWLKQSSTAWSLIIRRRA